VQAVTFTIPPEAVSPEHEERIPPEALSVMVALEVTLLPPESCTRSTGCVEKTEPDSPATGWVVKISLLAPPTPDGEKLLLVDEVRVPKLAVMV
jgi:hypothetical protein